ncbi:asparagine synthase (glutamine-hydrolyzing) [Deinococcus apachensis]|uniref:asparagine synthase (glutamine-hydrolyzing) n=1 Tax=Deinococcus apachensis TaxID=309886 RepID=UPI0003A41F0D|nr:asparagine synthase (glutamine-hydrolyzing) [Deinococcus apachensis]
MCGFVGYVQAGPGPRPDLRAWSDVIFHRGPDQGGCVQQGPFGVGTRRLSILDLSPAGNQPMRGERFVLAFNGEIYNHWDLRRALAREGVGPDAFRGTSDTETVLRAVEHWGVRTTLARLNGIYALALWDTRDASLTLARDPLGVKPLYVQRGPGGVQFASELKALRPHATGGLDREALALYFVFGFVPSPYTLLKGVRKVRPGEVLRIYRDSCRQAWITPEAWEQPLDPGQTPEEQVRATVEHAVERQLLADVPLGIALSGGVDSTLVAVLAARRTSDLSSFSIRPAHAGGPAAGADADLAAVTARMLGFRHHEIAVRPQEVLEESIVLSMLDEPVNEPYILAEILLSRATREAGVPVLLTGHAADELFLGYEGYTSVQRWLSHNRIPLLGAALPLVDRLPFLPDERRQDYRLAIRGWRRPLPEWYVLSTSAFSVEEAATLTGLPAEGVRAAVDGVMREAVDAAGRLPAGRDLHPLELFARLDLVLNVTDHYNLRLDRASMSQSVEARVPFQDLEVVNTALRLPHTTLLQGGLKGLLKDAFADLLPEEIRGRHKQKFQAPVARWVAEPLAPWVEEWTRRAGGWLDLTPLGAQSHPGRAASRRWSVALLEAWRRDWGLEA